MASLIPSVVVLSALLLVALAITRVRVSPVGAAPARRIAAHALLVTLGGQGAHFAEELLTGFHTRFPALFDQSPMPLAAFVTLNVACLTLWVAAVPGVRSGHPLALFAAWFLVLSGATNLIAHPLMAVVVGGYFPGLVTAPVVGVAALWLWSRLLAATERSV